MCLSNSRCRLARNFVRLGTSLQLSSSNRALFRLLIYVARLLPADILSVRDVIRWQLGYSIALCLKVRGTDQLRNRSVCARAATKKSADQAVACGRALI
jgi:hypothetical protein